MLTLIAIGLLGGLITGISPCILPVLPAVFVAGASGDSTGTKGDTKNRHAYVVIAGLVLSFTLFTLAGSALLDALNLPQDFLRDLGLVVLLAVGIGLIVPRIGELLEKPFSRIPQREVGRESGSFVLGVGLGLLYVPCAGPVLAAITVAGSTRQVGPDTVALTLAFAIGAAIPLLIFALAGKRVAERVRAFRTHAAKLRVIGGAVMIVLAIALSTNLTDALQRNVPGYTNALQKDIEGTKSAKSALAKIANNVNATNVGFAKCGATTTSSLQNCGTAPQFAGIQQWLNTPNNAPETLTQLKGKVVLVDFWTYSCINCQRTLPHVEAWYSAYQKAGLEVIGVHTPEFAFEHVASNVADQSKSLGVNYPVAIDNDYTTWNAYANEYWPAEYLVDATGNVRHVSFGEGEYDNTETLIRQLLTQANPSVVLPVASNLPNTTPTGAMSPETYLGYKYLQDSSKNYYDGNERLVPDKETAYTTPSPLPPGSFAFNGKWTLGSESSTPSAGASLNLAFQASDIYLVLGGEGTVTVSINGKETKTVAVSGTPRLYTLVSGTQQQNALLNLTFTSGVQAYDFTFG